jgi:hypothetical protein
MGLFGFPDIIRLQLIFLIWFKYYSGPKTTFRCTVDFGIWSQCPKASKQSNGLYTEFVLEGNSWIVERINHSVHTDVRLLGRTRANISWRMRRSCWVSPRGEQSGFSMNDRASNLRIPMRYQVSRVCVMICDTMWGSIPVSSMICDYFG